MKKKKFENEKERNWQDENWKFDSWCRIQKTRVSKEIGKGIEQAENLKIKI